MNRQIKFRVWDVEQNKFLSSYADKGIEFYHEQGKDWHEKQVRDIVPVSWFLQDHNNNLENYIVTQYTGLNDKNGKEIYEGDIVKINRCYTRPFVNEKQQIDYKFIDDGEVEVGQVLWGWNSQKYLVSYENIRYDDIEGFDKPSHRVEVIGNIFEHKHLLEK